MKRTYVASLLQALVLSVLLFSAVDASTLAEDPKPTLTLKDYSLFVDGVALAENAGSCGGRILWFSLPKQGQFIISTEVYEGYKFEKIAELRNNTISFSLEGKLYQLTSSAPILSDVSEMELWVLHDAAFQPKGCNRGVCAGSASPFEHFIKHREREESR